jgi:hypothetical protein
MKDPKIILENIYETYQFRNQKNSGYPFTETDKLRWLGGMEILLRCVGGLDGVTIMYEKRERKFLSFKFNEQESYEDFILGHARQFALRTGS